MLKKSLAAIGAALFFLPGGGFNPLSVKADSWAIANGMRLGGCTDGETFEADWVLHVLDEIGALFPFIQMSL